MPCQTDLMLVDTRRLADGLPAVDHFEPRGLPFLIGVNVFDPNQEHPLTIDSRRPDTVLLSAPSVPTATPGELGTAGLRG